MKKGSAARIKLITAGNKFAADDVLNVPLSCSHLRDTSWINSCLTRIAAP